MMTRPEADAYLAGQRVCRVATLAADSGPHVGALWYAWDGTALWLYSLVHSGRWKDIARDPRISVVVDDGHAYEEIRGVELRGRAEPVGEAPRTGEPVEELEHIEALFARKYLGRGRMPYDRRHAWLRMVPEKIVSWDFRKIPGVTGG
ncbi:pyridoxamine 5'-phosphate oxidase family protein [Streptomyces sp. NPDC051018]|uniref:pyridoxamine 5'-phosphate oxidase family protein n=1 Tax=Streptomyces sp. NPDC051018 TaxID=3365639 RepID=UPI003792A7A5